MAVIFNPTDEDFDGFHVGEQVIIPAGKAIKVSDSRASHMLNSLGPRGLMPLEFGDDEAKVRETGLARSREFKRRQVMMYNQDNEARQQRRMPFVQPPPVIKKYAKELGIGLLEPYNIRDLDNAEISKLQEENREKSNQIDALMKKLDAMMTMMSQANVVPPTDTEVEHEVLRKQFINLKREEFKRWIEDNHELIGAWPAEIKADVVKKYGKFFNKELVL